VCSSDLTLGEGLAGAQFVNSTRDSVCEVRDLAWLENSDRVRLCRIVGGKSDQTGKGKIVSSEDVEERRRLIIDRIRNRFSTIDGAQIDRLALCDGNHIAVVGRATRRITKREVAAHVYHAGRKKRRPGVGIETVEFEVAGSRLLKSNRIGAADDGGDLQVRGLEGWESGGIDNELVVLAGPRIHAAAGKERGKIQPAGDGCRGRRAGTAFRSCDRNTRTFEAENPGRPAGIRRCADLGAERGTLEHADIANGVGIAVQIQFAGG